MGKNGMGKSQAEFLSLEMCSGYAHYLQNAAGPFPQLSQISCSLISVLQAPTIHPPYL